MRTGAASNKSPKAVGAKVEAWKCRVKAPAPADRAAACRIEVA